MEEATKRVEPQNYSITVKMNAKRETYGEYTVRADTLDELERDLNVVKNMFIRSL